MVVLVQRASAKFVPSTDRTHYLPVRILGEIHTYWGEFGASSLDYGCSCILHIDKSVWSTVGTNTRNASHDVPWIWYSIVHSPCHTSGTTVSCELRNYALCLGTVNGRHNFPCTRRNIWLFVFGDVCMLVCC